ncbi:hypothetical protein [Pseudactinotalea sp. Z1748]|uniref:hypothetical protein n=1 Tax=Pseudactinotalea sp. Z1748 TaxID=3413027 RepID=UPI003C7A0D26
MSTKHKVAGMAAAIGLLLLAGCDGAGSEPGAVEGELHRATGESVEASPEPEADDPAEALDAAWGNFPQDRKEHLCSIIDVEWEAIADDWDEGATGMDGTDAILAITERCMDAGM